MLRVLAFLLIAGYLLNGDRAWAQAHLFLVLAVLIIGVATLLWLDGYNRSFRNVRK